LKTIQDKFYNYSAGEGIPTRSVNHLTSGDSTLMQDLKKIYDLTIGSNKISLNRIKRINNNND